MRAALATGLLCLAGLFWAGSAAAHAGHSDRAAWDACDDKQLSDVCAWEARDHSLYIGSCRSIQRSLICVRNQPVVPAGSTESDRSLDTAGEAASQPSSQPSQLSQPSSSSALFAPQPFAPLMLLAGAAGVLVVSRRKRSAN